MTNIRDVFESVLAGANYKVIQLPHPLLKVYAQNIDGCAALVVREEIPSDLLFKDGRGFNVDVHRDSPQQSVVIQSTNAAENLQFLSLVDFVLQISAKRDTKALSVASIPAAIEAFKRFMSPKAGRLTPEEVRGLFAEISVLRRLGAVNHSLSDAVHCWRGPFHSEGVGLHDFAFPDGASLEVKSMLRPSRSVRVSSAEQLRYTGSQLRLVAVTLDKAPPATSGAATLAGAINALLLEVELENPGAQSLVLDALKLLSLDVSDDYYEQWSFVVSKVEAFELNENFPQFTAAQVPHGVVDVRYSLDLDSLEPWRIDIQRAMDWS